MDFAKKMLLVDPARLAAMTTDSPIKDIYRPSIVDKQLSGLDKEISNTLNSSLPDDEKAKRYMIALRNYRVFDPKPVKIDETEQEILGSVPPELKPKAKKILKQIKPHVRWSDKGEIASDKELIPDSDMGELLTSALQHDNIRSRPKGFKEFADVLKRSYTPHDLIRNQSLLGYVKAKPRKTKKVKRGNGWIRF